jgi:dipeptidyl aminopeptidase/acylaminoacyl peptidase
MPRSITSRSSQSRHGPGGNANLVTRDFDRETARYALTPDGKFVYLLVPEAGKENLYRVATEGGTPVLMVAPPTGGYTSLEIAQKAATPELIASYGSSVSPEEIVRIDLAQRSHVNLTQIDTAAAAAIDWQPPEHFYFTSGKGRSLHNMIVRPPAFDPTKKYPMVVLDPRRRGQQQPRSDRPALELSPARGARLRDTDDRLHGLDGLRREVCAGNQARSLEDARR